jgi:hypothetical protein
LRNLIFSTENGPAAKKGQDNLLEKIGVLWYHMSKNSGAENTLGGLQQSWRFVLPDGIGATHGGMGWCKVQPECFYLALWLGW